MEIDTGILLENVNAILKSLNGAALIPVLKDDAYGLGMAAIAAVLCTVPEIRCFAVSHVSEGLDLTASDVSEGAVALAERNARLNRVEGEFLQGNLFEPVKDRKFDMILSNPPYIKTNMIGLLQDEVKDHEPRIALDGGKDGLVFYRRIVEQAPDHLKKDGFLMLEIGHDQGEELKTMIERTGKFRDLIVLKDLGGRDRVVSCRRI